MLHTDFINNVKIITIALIMVVLVGCGGGRATTSSSEQSGNGTTGNGTKGATLNWLPPTMYTDNTPLTELVGHNIYINDGNGFTKLTTINNPGVTTYVVENLAAGTYTFAVTAYDAQGIESAFSNQASISVSS